jgi:hypothetical protein
MSPDPFGLERRTVESGVVEGGKRLAERTVAPRGNSREFPILGVIYREFLLAVGKKAPLSIYGSKR